MVSGCFCMSSCTGKYPFACDTEVATYSKIAAYSHCPTTNRQRMLNLATSTELEGSCASDRGSTCARA